MRYFKEVLSLEELKSAYRRLALAYHPDLGGDVRDMQNLNKEYKVLTDGFRTVPGSLKEVKIGNTVYVNQTKCIVTAVEKELFKAKSLSTKREALFSKTTGYAMLNYKIRASLSCT